MIDNNGGIAFGGHAVNKQIIIAAGNMIDRGKALVKKTVLFIRQVSANAHIGRARQGKRKILQCSMKSFKTDKLV